MRLGWSRSGAAARRGTGSIAPACNFSGGAGRRDLHGSGRSRPDAQRNGNTDIAIGPPFTPSIGAFVCPGPCSSMAPAASNRRRVHEPRSSGVADLQLGLGDRGTRTGRSRPPESGNTRRRTSPWLGDHRRHLLRRRPGRPALLLGLRRRQSRSGTLRRGDAPRTRPHRYQRRHGLPRCHRHADAGHSVPTPPGVTGLRLPVYRARGWAIPLAD